ncbi:vacuolar protein sorting-associated protein 4-like [Liolophura sinensis]|uniref:vacuolar protein sorting-associated protein 4-like n=1 Tax=Liolophura sinensis TaxID=3198878 RepID=UPI0031597898
MDDTTYRIYEEASRCLEEAVKEAEKPSNVDIQLLLSNVQHSQSMILGLAQHEPNEPFKTALHQLAQTLEGQSNLLFAKMRQLDQQQNEQKKTSPRKRRTKEEDIECSTHASGDSAEKFNRSLAIEETIVRKSSIKFSDVAGLYEAKQALREAIIMPLQYPQLFTGGRKPWKRILLYGPPGTGKSRLAQAVSAEIQSAFYSVSSADLVSSWVGESERLVKELFHHATKQDGRSVIFIDEIDSVCRQRSSREEEHTRRIKTELLKQMEGADNSNQSDKIFLLCATNCPWELDPAFLRRFQKRIYVPLPDKCARLVLFKIHARDNTMALVEKEWQELAERTEGFSGSDIATLTLGALFEPVRDLQSATHWRTLPNGKLTPCNPSFPRAKQANMTDLPADRIQPRDVLMSDFLRSIHTHRTTVTETELKKFHEFTATFGQHG